jgi:hypothetical protein
LSKTTTPALAGAAKPAPVATATAAANAIERVLPLKFIAQLPRTEIDAFRSADNVDIGAGAIILLNVKVNIRLFF